MKTESNTLGHRLRARRIALGLTLADVADRSGLSLPYVSNLERTRGNPTLDAIGALAKALETSVGVLLGDGGTIDPLEIVLAETPPSLQLFARSDRFGQTVQALAKQQRVKPDEMRRRLLVGMASAPRRSKGEPSEEDWRRLLDTYRNILGE